MWRKKRTNRNNYQGITCTKRSWNEICRWSLMSSDQLKVIVKWKIRFLCGWLFIEWIEFMLVLWNTKHHHNTIYSLDYTILMEIWGKHRKNCESCPTQVTSKVKSDLSVPSVPSVPPVPLGQLKMFTFNSFFQPFCSFQLSSLVFSWPLTSNISQFSPNKPSLCVIPIFGWRQREVTIACPTFMNTQLGPKM